MNNNINYEVEMQTETAPVPQPSDQIEDLERGTDTEVEDRGSPLAGSPPEALSEAVKNLFGLSYLFPYQRLVITNILEAAKSVDNEQTDRGTLGKQIVILPTGAGKSLCFQLPAMMIEGLTLVIYPILSLMADQQRRLNERGFSPVTIRGGQSKEERDEIWEKLESGQAKFIIANPEVLMTVHVKERLELIKIKHVVIDEAHCVSE